MLCFLAPVPAMPENGSPQVPPTRRGSGMAAVIVVVAALCALLTPIGWTARPKGAAPPPAPPVPRALVPARCVSSAAPAPAPCR